MAGESGSSTEIRTGWLRFALTSASSSTVLIDDLSSAVRLSSQVPGTEPNAAGSEATARITAMGVGAMFARDDNWGVPGIAISRRMRK